VGDGPRASPVVLDVLAWEDTSSLSAYAYGKNDSGHPYAIAADRTKPFFLRSAFIRFRPYGSEGSLGGMNPLSEAWGSE